MDHHDIFNDVLSDPVVTELRQQQFRHERSSMGTLLLAHDLGTSGNKATLFSESGELIDSAVCQYDTYYGPGGVAEQNPEDWWRAVSVSTRKIMAGRNPRDIAAIAFSGQMMGCLCVDRDGLPLRNHILYCDQRSLEEEREFADQGGIEEIYRITGHRASASYGATKLMWVKKHQPEIYAKTYKMLNAKDWLNFRLTGRMVTEPSDASGTNLYDLRKGEWSRELVQAAGLDWNKLPELVQSIDVVGTLTGEAAETLSLVPGIPVVAGAGDGVASGVGAGSVAPGRTYNYLGSSSWVATTSTEPVYDKARRTFTWAHAVPGLFHPAGTMQTAAASYLWLKNEICHEETRLAEESGRSPYEVMNEVAALSPAGANQLIYLPYLLGERSPRWNPAARGGFIGLTMAHTRADMVRAVLEGVSMNLAVIIDIFREQGNRVDDIIVIGGGAKGAVWRHIMADVYDATIVLPNYLEEATSIGAAIIAGVGAGVFSDFSIVDRFFAILDTIQPDTATQAVYRKNRDLVERLYQALEPVFPHFA